MKDEWVKTAIIILHSIILTILGSWKSYFAGNSCRVLCYFPFQLFINREINSRNKYCMTYFLYLGGQDILCVMSIYGSLFCKKKKQNLELKTKWLSVAHNYLSCISTRRWRTVFSLSINFVRKMRRNIRQPQIALRKAVSWQGYRMFRLPISWLL